MSEPQPNSVDAKTVAPRPEILPEPSMDTLSSLSPQENTSSGETRSPAPLSTVVGIGSQLGPYQLLDKLGEGGMGAVYKARHAKLGKLVALKILPQHVLSRPDALARFDREMMAVGSLHHPNVVQAHDAGEIGGVHYLSMEYVEGQDLLELLKAKGPMSVINACKAIRQAAIGLAAAHKLGLIHRDIKPSNLFVTKETGQIKILDMGLALLSQEQAPTVLTSEGDRFGTADYMPPEQWEDAHTCDARADLYALGCTLFQLLVGRAPYGSSEYRTVPRKMMGHVRDPIPDLQAARLGATGGSFEPPVSSKSTGERSPSPVAPDTMRTDEGVRPTSDIPDGLDAIYRKLMAKEPKDRFASADQLAEALAPFTRQSSPHAPREESRTTSDIPKRSGSDAPQAPSDGPPTAAFVTRSVTATLSEASTSGDSSSQRTPPRGPNRKWLFAAGGAAALVMLGVIIITITNKDGTKTRIEVPGDSKVEVTKQGDAPKTVVTKAPISSTTKPLTLLPQLDLDETDPLPEWELPTGAPLPVVAPCEPQQAKERQQQWAEFLKRPVVEEPFVGDRAEFGMKFALIPPGEFRKIFTRPRDPAIEPDMPVRRFRLTKPYALSTTEVTWDQFRQFVEATGYQTEAETNGLGGRDREFNADPKITWRAPGWKPDPNEPVTQVTPRDAEAFCEWLSRLGAPARPDDEKSDDGKKDKDRTGKSAHPTYRLPTEAEWVHACRAGSVHRHVVGPDPQDLADYAWTQEFLDPNPQASPLHLVAQKKPNPFGLHDTLGSVWEYTHDYLSLAQMQYLSTNDPLSYGSGTILGNAWTDPQGKLHPDWGFPDWTTPYPNTGFRVLKQFDGEPLPGPLDRPLVMRAGQPLSVHALVPRPEKIPGLRSWSLELAGPHGQYTTAIAVSPKSDLIATGGYGSGKISLWDRDGNYQRALLGHEGVITSLDFSPDGRWLASCERVMGDRGIAGITARLWNVETGALHSVIPLPGWAYRIKFSPNSEQLAVSFNGQYQPSFVIVELATGSSRNPPNAVAGLGLAWSPDGKEIVCSHTDSHLRVWDAKTLKVVRDVEAPGSESLEWSPDGQWIALKSAEGHVAIHDAKTLAVARTIKVSVPVLGSHLLAWLPDSQRLLVVGQGSAPFGVFDAVGGETLATFAGTGNVAAIALCKDGQEAVLEAGGRLHFYDTSTGQKLREGKERGGVATYGSTLTANGREVFSAGYNQVLVHDTATGAFLRRFPQSVNWNASPHPSSDASTLAVAAELPTVQFIDSQTGAKRYELSHGQGNVMRVAWSPDGKWLATGATDKLVRVWNSATGKIEHELAGHTGTIWSLAWSPDGTRLASAAEDKTVRLWDPLAGKLVASYDQFPEAMLINGGHLQNLAWSMDSRRLWIAVANHIVPLDVETGTLGPLENFSNGGSPGFLNTSPDGQRLLVREGYGWTFVRGRDAQDHRLLGQHLGHTAQWHPDSRRFLRWEYAYGTVGFDVETNRRLGMLFPWLTGDHWLCLGPTGHYRGSPGASDQIVYVAMLEDGSQRTYTPAEFAKTFGWKNDPEKATLLQLEK